METIKIKDKEFAVSIPESLIQKEVERVANEINRDLKDANPIFLSVLNGSFMFAADLMKHIRIPSQISFIKLASYEGTSSTGVIKEVMGLSEDITGRTVVVIEDIVDTGQTMQRLLETLGTRRRLCAAFAASLFLQHFRYNVHAFADEADVGLAAHVSDAEDAPRERAVASADAEPFGAQRGVELLPRPAVGDHERRHRRRA